MTAPTPDCPSPDELEAIAAGETAGSAVAAHLARCPHCAESIELARFGRRFSAVMRDEAPAPPAQAGNLPCVHGYRLIRERSRGGQGIVYAGEQVLSGKLVAVKILAPSAYAHGEARIARARLDREIRIVASLDHPNVVRLLDSVTLPGGGIALIMEYVDGLPLDEWVRQTEHRNASSILEILACIADGLHHAHQRGIMHRDLKPANILVDRAGSAKLLDFGIARPLDATDSASALTRSGAFAGTLAYAAPEQITGGRAAPDIRSDIYALGVIAYELLAGAPPYTTSGSLDTALRNIREASPRNRSQTGIAIDPWTVMMKAMAKDPARRYQSADEMAGDLRRAARGEAIGARADSHWYVTRKAIRRHRVAASFAALTLAGLLSVLAIVVTSNHRLSKALHERTMRHLDALIWADARERAEALLWPEIDRLIPRRDDPGALLWSGNVAQREALFQFMRLQSRSTCIGIDRSFTRPPLALTAMDERGFLIVTPQGAALRIEPGETRFRIEHAGTAETDVRSTRMTPDGALLVILGRERLTCIGLRDAGIRVSRLLSGKADEPISLAVTAGHAAVCRAAGEITIFTLPELIPVGHLTARAGGHHPWIDPVNGTLWYACDPDALCAADLRRSDFAVRQYPFAASCDARTQTQVIVIPQRMDAMLACGGRVILSSFEPQPSRVRTLLQTGSRVNLAIDRSGRTLAAHAYGDSSLRLWHTESWQELPPLTGHSGAVAFSAFSPGGTQIMTADLAGVLRLWTVPGHGWRQPMYAHAADAHALAISRDGARLYIPDRVGGLRICDVSEGIGRSTEAKPADRVITAMPCARVIACSDGDIVAAADLGRRIMLISPDPAAHPKMIDLDTPSVIAALAAHPRSPDIFAATMDGELFRIDSRSGALLAKGSLPTGSVVSDIACSPDGSTLSAALRDGRLVRIDTASMSATRIDAADNRHLRSLTYMEGGRTIAAVGDEGRLLLIDAASGQIRRSPRLSEDSLFTLTVHPSQSTVIIGDRTGGITFVDLRTLTHLGTLRAKGGIMSLVCSPDGRYLYVAALDQPVEVWDLGGLARTLQAIRPPAVTPTGRASLPPPSPLPPAARPPRLPGMHRTTRRCLPATAP